jgi:hypothetical protein
VPRSEIVTNRHARTLTPRLDHIRHFYALLDRLAGRAGGLRVLGDSCAAMGWPVRGSYFFFEPGEERHESGSGPRVVRVGAHALKPGSRSTLWGRLRHHCGTKNPPGGNHRASVFRSLVGSALAKRDPALAVPSWAVGSTAPRAVRENERALEASVSETIGRMRVLALAVDDQPGPSSLRAYVVRNTIALLANSSRPAIDAASPDWLGRECPCPRAAGSGLWNTEPHIDAAAPAFLEILEFLVERTRGGAEKR